MIDVPQLSEMVRRALVRADSDAAGVPDYDVLAETAVKIVLEAVAKEAIAEAIEG